MPKVVYDQLTYATLSSISIYLQLADQSIHHPAEIAENIPVNIRNFVILVDFMVLNMDVDKKIPLILGRPFLSSANANNDVGAGEIEFTINGTQEKFNFKPKLEQCSLNLVTEVALTLIMTRIKKKQGPVPRVKPKRIWKKT